MDRKHKALCFVVCVLFGALAATLWTLHVEHGRRGGQPYGMFQEAK